MARALRIAGLLDLLIADDPGQILGLARDPRLDRRFEPAGPLLNRIIAGRVRRVLRIDGRPLPAVAPRAAPGRAERQAELEARIADRRVVADDEHLDALAAHVLGRRDPEAIGPLAQEAVGRLFMPEYRSTPGTWAAALLLDAAARSFNPLRNLVRLITGSVRRARRLLADRVDRDPAALHTTGIAVHNLVRALDRMRDLAARPAGPRGFTAAQAVSICLAAPDGVLRQATAIGATVAGTFRPGTLVLFRLDAAHAASLQRDIAFMTEEWSRCPAHAWVPALLAAAWERAAAAPPEGSRP